MKRIISILIVITSCFTACRKSEIINIAAPAKTASLAKPESDIKGAKDKITVDFSAISDQTAIVTLTGSNGEGTFVFYSVDGNIQTRAIPRNSTYTVKWEYYAVNPVECNYMLYWNYTGISVYGTSSYGWISTCCVSFEKNAALTFYKNC
jgi:hypothetical protein